MTTALGKRSARPVIAGKFAFRHPDTGAPSHYYWATRGWVTNPNDTVDPNRRFDGILTKVLDFDISWVSGDALAGVSRRNYGTIEAVRPRGRFNVDEIATEKLSNQGCDIVLWIGEVGEDLGDMVEITLKGRHVRLSEDGRRWIIDATDGGQALDTALHIDTFQGAGRAVQHAAGVVSTIPDDVGLDPSTQWCLTIAYRLSPGAGTSSLIVTSRPAAGGGSVCEVLFDADGHIRISTVDDGTSMPVHLDAEDLQWVADGRLHKVVGLWRDGTLQAFHSTRRGGAKSATTAAASAMVAGDGDLLFGDVDNAIVGYHTLDVAEFALELDANVPSDEQILARMKRPFNEEEIAACEVYLDLEEGPGETTAVDLSGNGHDATVPDAWVHTFEGRAEMAGKKKPLSLGDIENMPITWADAEAGVGVVHSLAYKGARAVLVGAARQVIGWPRTRWLGVVFDAATKTISIPEREDPPGTPRLDAQASFAGLVDGQKLVVLGTSANDATYTLDGSSTDRTITVLEALTDETAAETWLEAQNSAGGAPDVALHFWCGGALFSAPPRLPATAELLGDIGADIPTDDAGVHFPMYAASIMKRILTGWLGISESAIASTWDEPPLGGVSGVWVDPARPIKVRELFDEGDNGQWDILGEDHISDEWERYRVDDPDDGDPDLELTQDDSLGLRRLKDVNPVGGLTLLYAINYRPLNENEIAGAALVLPEDAERLRRKHLEAPAVIDPAVAVGYPEAEVPPPIRTWLRHRADAEAEAQRRYDILRHKRRMYRIETQLTGIDRKVLRTRVRLTHSRYPELVAGRKFWLARLEAKGKRVGLTLALGKD